MDVTFDVELTAKLLVKEKSKENLNKFYDGTAKETRNFNCNLNVCSSSSPTVDVCLCECRFNILRQFVAFS